MKLQHVRSVCSRALGCLLLAICLTACHGGNIDKFKDKFAEGDLTEAQKYLTKISDHLDAEHCALKLIKAYVEAGSVDKAINVYEKITTWHKGRYKMGWKSEGDYDHEVCKLLRTALMRNGEYEKAWNYYSLSSEEEDSYDNAKDRYLYLSDVVDDMCNKGKQEEASKFVDKNLRWFARNIDNMDDDSSIIEYKQKYGSTVVREKLMEQIENSY